MNSRQIYLDFNASTPIAPEVAEAMKPFLSEHYGNPSSHHWAGEPAKEAVEQARRQVADLLQCRPDEIVFSSGGSESNNHAIKGIFFTLKEKGNHIITTQIEHPAVINPCRFLERLGAEVTYVGADQYGRVDPEDIRKAITPKTVLITVMHANNEVGTIQPIEEISKIAKNHGILFHTDAAQSVGKIKTTVDDLGVDLLSIAGHKLYAPKGVGALYIREGTAIESLIHGAGHESGRRAGTENVLLIAGLGKACEIAKRFLNDSKILDLRDRFWGLLKNNFGSKVVLNGHPIHRLPNTLNISFAGRVGSEILDRLEGVAASTGAACHSGSIELSPVLKAMGISPEVGMGAIRFSLGRMTTFPELERVIGLLKKIVYQDTIGRINS
ncbi:MAG: cysteine desulfurase family protein [Thermodesulfobacteriota bacterium]|nr:cysteine desulfurase family protein [Thermodesulfobacteriota bacterium]